MDAQLTDLHVRLQSNAKRAESLVSRAGEARIDLRPKPDSWSAAECLTHLTMSTDMFFPAWRAVLAGGMRGNGPYKMDLIGRMLKWTLEPPPRFRVKAPAHLHPVASGDVLQNFLKSQNQLLEIVSAASGLALDRIRIASPVDARVRYNIWSSFQVAEAHQRRHLWQAERAAGPSE